MINEASGMCGTWGMNGTQQQGLEQKHGIQQLNDILSCIWVTVILTFFECLSEER